MSQDTQPMAEPLLEPGEDAPLVADPEWEALRSGENAAREHVYRRFADSLYRALFAWSHGLGRTDRILNHGIIRVLGYPVAHGGKAATFFVERWGPLEGGRRQGADGPSRTQAAAPALRAGEGGVVCEIQRAQAG